MFAAGKRLVSVHVRSRKSALVYSLVCNRNAWSRDLSSLRLLQLQTPNSFGRLRESTSSTDCAAFSSLLYHSLSTDTKANKLNRHGEANSYLSKESTSEAGVAHSHRSQYIRKDNLKWRKSPWKVKQLRFTRHIMNLVRKGKVDEAHDVFEQMKKGKVHPEVAIFNTLIAGYGRRGNVHASFRLFNEMKKRSLLPTDHTYSSLFAACAEYGPKSSRIVDKVQDEIERRSILLNNISLNALITALASCGRHDDALGVYSDMIKRNMNPDLHTFGSLLLAAANDKEGGFEVAQRMWSEMIASGLNPDLHCFNVLLQCVRDSGISHILPDKVKERRTVDLNLDLNSTDGDSSRLQCDSTSVEIYVSGTANFTLGQESRFKVHLGQVQGRRKSPPLRWLEVEDIEMLFSLFKKLRVRPEIRTFHLLAHLSLNPSPLFTEMGKRKVHPDSQFMVAAIKMQSLLGNLAGAELLLEYSRKTDLTLGQAGYQAVATSCHGEKEGIKLINEMTANHVLPNEYVFGTLIGNAARTRSYEYLTALLKKMLHLEVVPNDTILEILEAAANHKPNGVRQAKRLSGYRGYYKIWKKLMVPSDDGEDIYNSRKDQSEHW